jgi:hypothetical protein
MIYVSPCSFECYEVFQDDNNESAKANGSYSTEFKTVPADKQLKKTDGKTDWCKNECPVASLWGNKGADYFVITSTIQY